MIFLWFGVLAISLFVLLKSADYFIEDSVSVGTKLKIPSFVLGATIVAFGTSLPELAVAISAILKDAPAIISGTVLGSNISNIFFILGVAIIIGKGFKIDFKKNAAPLLILFFVTGIVSYFLWDNEYSLTDGLISVGLLVAYILYIVFIQKPEDEEDEEEPNDRSILKSSVFILLSGVGIWAGAEFVIMAITKVAQLLNIKEDIISLTVVALGTSLPELAVTIVAVKKNRYGIVLGNIIGSNVFNMLCVLGIPVVIGHFTNHPYIINDAVFTGFSIPLMLLATVLMLLISFFKSIPKVFGIVFVLLYLFFIIGTFLKINLLETLYNI